MLEKMILFLVVAMLAQSGRMINVVQAQANEPPGPSNSTVRDSSTTSDIPKVSHDHAKAHEVGPPYLVPKPLFAARIDPRENVKLLKKANSQLATEEKQQLPDFRAAAAKKLD